MWIPSEHQRLARKGAHSVFVAYEDYERRFQSITRRAKSRFENRDWHGMQQDAVERLELYGRVITGIVADIREQLGASLKDKKLWATMKREYAEQISRCQDIELAETFFNSV